MRKVPILLFTATLTFSQFGCTNDAVNGSSNQTNVSQTAANTNQVNANVKPADAPVPTFTNADEALAEGKRWLDELETEKAIDALKQATKLNADLAEAHFNLGIAYALIEKDEEDKILTQVETTPTPKPSKIPKKNAPPIRTKNSEKAFENAVKAYKKILAKNPKDDVSHFNLGRAYNKLNEDEDAMKALKEAVKLKPDDYEYQMELGAVYMKLAQYEEAVAALKKTLALDPNNLQAEDLLEKAQAGQKRVDFGNKPKPPQPPPGQPRSRSKNTSEEDEMPDAPTKEQPKEQPKEKPKEQPKPNANKQ